jgi:hypothetical protein
MVEMWRVILLLNVGGAIGGLLYWTSTYLSNVNVPAGVASNKWKPGVLFCLANAFMGVGGAWAALLTMFWARRVPLGRAPGDLIEFLATSIIAGYAGSRILPAVAAGMTQQLLESATATALAAAQSANRSRVLTQAMVYLAPGSPHSDAQTAHVLSELKEEHKAAPDSAKTTALLARVMAECLQDRSGAMDLLRTFAASKQRTEAELKTIATTFWDLALSFERQFQTSSQPEAREQAIAAASEAVTLDPSSRSSFAAEPAFHALREDAAAKAILSPPQ